MRVDLPDGQWAELRERPTTNQLNIVRRALLRTVDEAEAGADVFLAYIGAYVSSWHVVTDGHEIPLERAGDADDVIVGRVAYEASVLYRDRPDPKDSGRPSTS